MIKLCRKYGIAVIALVVVAAVFMTGFACGRRTVNAQQTHAEHTETHADSGTGFPVPPAEVPVYTEYTLTATAYCPCEKCCGVWATKRPLDDNGKPIVYTASGTVAAAGRTVAADTSVFPFGTVLVIDGAEYIVEDRGGAIKGNRIDVYFDTHEAARQFGRQTVTALVKM